LQSCNKATRRELMKKRIKYLDLIKFFAIYCVILGHLIQYIGADPWHNPIWMLIYSFHVPLFMIMSGYFFSSSVKLSFRNFIKKKAVQLVLPALTWYIILCILNSCINFIINKELILKYDLHGLLNSFWFLKSLFCCYVIAYLSLKLIKNELLACLLSCIVLCLIPFGNFAATNFLLPFFWIGFFFQKHRLNIENNMSLLWGVSLFSFVGSLTFWSGNYTIYKYPIELLLFKPLHFAPDSFLVMLYRLFIGLAGSFFFIFSIKFLQERYGNTDFADKLCTIGKQTLGVYLIQTIVFEVFFYALSLCFSSFVVNVFSPILTVVILAFCLFIIKVIERNKYTRLFLLGIK